MQYVASASIPTLIPFVLHTEKLMREEDTLENSSVGVSETKKYPQVELRLVCIIFTPRTKECPFAGHQSAAFEIRDIEQQD